MQEKNYYMKGTSKNGNGKRVTKTTKERRKRLGQIIKEQRSVQGLTQSQFASLVNQE